ncbi:MAG: membrane-associated phospholipid phosphatase [Maribacter sp.]|jgi:membrane-associated phospholipid phosphatase
MRIIAHAVSFVFHPLFVMTYIAVLLSFINPYLFGVHDAKDNVVFILRIFMSTFFLPAFAVFMMKSLGFIQTLEMEDRQERIGPLIVTIVLYLWMSYNFYKSSIIPNAYTIFIVGATMGLCIAFFINVFSKISLHAIGIGGFLGMIIIIMMYFSYGSFNIGSISMSMNFLLMIVIIICGMVGTSRLILGAHEPMDLYGGFFIGFGTQFLALTILS